MRYPGPDPEHIEQMTAHLAEHAAAIAEQARRAVPIGTGSLRPCRFAESLASPVRIATWMPVPDELMEDARDFRDLLADAMYGQRHPRPWHGPPAPPLYGPALPTDVDEYRWAALQLEHLDVAPELARILAEALANAIDYVDHDCY